MLAHNACSGVQPKSSALANAFGSKKWLKDVRQNLFWNPRAVVCDLNDDAGILAIRTHTKVALATHRVNRVVNDVGPDLIQLAAKRIHQKRNALIVPVYCDSALEFVVQDRKRSLQAFNDVNILDRRLVHV